MSRSRQQQLFEQEPAPPSAESAAPLPPPPPPPVIAAPPSVEPIVAAAPQAPTSLAGKRVWVVDANSLIFQVFHAIPEMTSPQGEPVSAIFGFTRDLFAILQQHEPDYLLIAFDRPEPTFRHGLYERYKGDRAEMPVDLRPQFGGIRQVLDAMRLPVLECAGYEADDILATVAHQTEQLGGTCVLVTGDKDARQLLSDQVKIFNVRKQQFFDESELKADWGIRPNQVVDYQSLVGDSVDAIPGVPLVGPKIAAEWLQKFDTLEQLFEKADQLPKGKRRDNLITFRDQALLSRQLARLVTEVPLAFDWTARHWPGVDRETLASLFAGFGFHSLGQKVASLPGATVVAEWQTNYQLVDTPDKLTQLVARLRQVGQFSLDTETTHIWPRWAELVGYSFAVAPGEAYYVPVKGPSGEPVLSANVAREALRPLLEDPNFGKVGQNLKYDFIVLRREGINVQGLAFDTMLASYLLDAGERIHGIDELSERYLKHTKIKTTSIIGSGKTQRTMDQAPVAQVSDYACEDADAAWRLVAILSERLAAANLTKLLQDVELPLVEVLAALETTGIQIDVPRLQSLSQQYGEQMQKLEIEIHEFAGHPFNIASPKQLAQVLFDELKLPILKKTKTGGSTDAEVLEELARVHPLPAKIMDYRQYAKLKSTYLDALPTMVHPTSGRVHTSFNQVVAATGRLSSNDPNLQNIPIRTPQGREIREAFVPGFSGWKLLSADYSQIELRVLAHYCQDAELVQAFAREEDIHASVAAEVHQVPLDQVTSEMRRAAKAVNFGVIYGQSSYGLAKQLGISQEKAAQFIDSYFGRYRGVEAFMNQVLVDCHRSGYVTTLLGRRRAISGVRIDGSRQRNLAERTAINTVIQGSAADLIKLAMIAIQRRLQQENWKAQMLLQIHDELVFEAPPEEIESLSAMVVEEMTGVYPLAVPLRVDVGVGDTWAATG